MRHGDSAWIALAVGVAVYEIAAPPGELLSEAVDRYRAKHRWLTTVGIVYTAAHLLRLWPAPLDPLHRLAVWMGR
jgi:hypothetical protein